MGEGLGGLVKFLRVAFLESFFKQHVTSVPVSLSFLAGGRFAVRVGL